jgi:hypothetical protein
VQIAIPDVAVAEHERLGLFSKVLEQTWPLPDVKGDVIGQHSALLPHSRHCHIFPDLPDLVVLLVVVGNDGVVEVLQLLEQRIELLSRRLHEEHVVVERHCVEDGRVEVADHCVVGMAVNILQSGQVLAESALDEGKALQDEFEVVGLEDHYLADLIDLLAEDVELGDHAQSALPADEQLLQVVTRVVLVDLRPHVQHVAVGHHCFQAQDVRTERTVFNHVLPASVGGGIPSNLAGAFRSEV